jgi:hypothetical protein
MIFSFHVGLTASVMQRMQLFFCQCLFRIARFMYYFNIPKKVNKRFFCSTLSEFENFRLCERILINLTTCQNETSS